MPPRWPRGRTSRRRWRAAATQLDADLLEAEHERPRDVRRRWRGTRGSRGWRACRPPTRLTVSIAASASPESRLPRLVPPSASSPRPVLARRLDRGAVARGSSRSRPGRSPCPPTGTRGCRGCRRAGSRPGWRRSARRGRSPIRSGGGCPPPASAPSIGVVPSRTRGAAPGSARPSISRNTMPGGVGGRRAAGAPRDAPGHAVGVRRVVVDAGDHARGGADRRRRGARRAAPSRSRRRRGARARASAAISSIAASAASTSRKPSPAVNGSRSAARSGGTAR